MGKLSCDRDCRKTSFCFHFNVLNRSIVCLFVFCIFNVIDVGLWIEDSKGLIPTSTVINQLHVFTKGSCIIRLAFSFPSFDLSVFITSLI